MMKKTFLYEHCSMKRLMQWQAHKKLNGNRESGLLQKKEWKMKKENGKNGKKEECQQIHIGYMCRIWMK